MNIFSCLLRVVRFVVLLLIGGLIGWAMIATMMPLR